MKTTAFNSIEKNGIARQVLRGLLMMAMLAAASGTGAQQAKSSENFPTRAVRWVVPFTPGASNDVIARLLSQTLTEMWGQQVVVDNRGGAGGMVGADIVAKSTADGYTLLLANPGANAINFALRKKTPYRAEDFAPVILLGWSPIMLATSAGFPANSVKELIAMAKAKQL